LAVIEAAGDRPQKSVSTLSAHGSILDRVSARVPLCGEAGDGIEAVEKVHPLRPDLVLRDINMPRMDGLEATRIIRRESPDCSVVIVTQNDATVAREQARSVDAKAS
jgi:CheY-like chemotaxis protein